MIVKAAHLTELRSALAAALAVLSLAPPPYNQPTITPGATVIKRIDQQEIRDRLN